MSELIKAGAIWLFGTVVKDDWIWPGDTGLFSAKMVIDALGQFSGDVTVMVNCDGGSPSEGEAIRAALEAHPGKVTVKVTGNAHSAASLMIMSADRTEMSAGSLMLVHDPSAPAYGNPDQLRAAADDLSAMADAYAAVYAARAGITPEAAREIMKAETMFNAKEAVAAGFADAVTASDAAADVDPVMQYDAAKRAARAAFNRAQEAQMKFEAQEAGLGDGASQETGQMPNGNEVVNMVKPNTQAPGAVAPAAPAAGGALVAPQMQATPAPAAPAPASAPAAPVAPASAPVMQDPAPVAPAPAPQMSATDAVAAERARQQGIREAAAPFMAHIQQAEVDRMCHDGTTLEQANARILAVMSANQPRGVRVEIRRDEAQTQVEGMIGALMHRANPLMHALEGPAEQYRGMRLRNLAMHLAGGSAGFNEIETIRAGLRSTSIMSGAMGVSDFAYITTEVMNRTLRAAYERRASTWRRISRQRSASDFRAMHSITAGGDFQLKPVGENGEYLQSTITDEASGLKVAKYGRQINLTFEAIVNDDMGVFERLPGDFARAAGTLESKIAWGLIRDNAKTGDGTALFHADHGNLGAAGAISVATVGQGRKAMWEQRPAGSKDKDDFIAVSPDLLFAPPALETEALQFVAAATPAKAADANPFGSTLTPAVEPSLGAAAGGSDSRWYLFASDLPVLEHAFLDGYEAPTVMTKEGMNPDGVSMTARHIFGATAAEFRGAYRRG
ncbi:head maturation protease, ClpP-related [Cribrihabitans pelagius]|uniref:head maturation protease, ClpP-related n=1 Tax=Cribrihabitans pelagius TaxID=1765746 RepID=UPI003B5ACDBD